MAIAYAYYEVENFPEMQIGDERQTATQLSFPGDDDTIHTTIRFLGNSEHKAFSKYRVTHETIKRIKARFQNEYRNQIIAVMEFNLFRAQQASSVLITAKGLLCREMFKRFERAPESFPDFQWLERRVDLAGLGRDLAGGVTGGWFTRRKIADLRSAGIFGPTVAESDEWMRYEQAGDLSSLLNRVHLCRCPPEHHDNCDRHNCSLCCP